MLDRISDANEIKFSKHLKKQRISNVLALIPWGTIVLLIYKLANVPTDWSYKAFPVIGLFIQVSFFLSYMYMQIAIQQKR